MVSPFSSWSDAPTSSVKPNQSPHDKKDAPKKPRHRHSAFQLAALNELFDRNEHPSLDERTMLAERLNMETKTVNSWFQNKRASSKKRHKGTTHPCELPPISTLIASVSGSTTRPPSEYDEFSDDERLPALSERYLSPFPRATSSEHNASQTQFFVGNPKHTHSMESDSTMPRKMRSRPTPMQTEELRKLYDISPHPSKEEREYLGNKIGMPYGSVTNWFQNQRSIAKKRKEDAAKLAPKSKSRTFSPFPPASNAAHPSFSVPPGSTHPSLLSLVQGPRARRSYNSTPAAADSRPSSPRAAPYRATKPDSSSSGTSTRPRRTRPEPYQLDALKRLFHRTPTPSIEERGALALEIGMDVGKVTNWFRNLRQTARKRARAGGDDDDDGELDEDNVSLATYADDSRAGSSEHDEPMDIDEAHFAQRVRVKIETEEKHNRMYAHAPGAHSPSDMGSEEDFQEAVTPSPESSPPPPARHRHLHPHREISLAASPLVYAEAQFPTGVKVEDALLLLSFHHHIVR